MVKKRVEEVYKARLIRMDDTLYNEIRKWAYLEKRTMSSLIRDCIEDKLKNIRNVLTKADI